MWSHRKGNGIPTIFPGNRASSIARRVGFVNLLVRAAAVGVDVGDDAAVRLDDLLAARLAAHAEQGARAGLVGRSVSGAEQLPWPAPSKNPTRDAGQRDEDQQLDHCRASRARLWLACAASAG